MHRLHHNANAAAKLAAAGLVLALAACAPMTRPDPPGPLGALIDRWPPAVTIEADGPYPNPLADAVPPLITPDIADRMIAKPLLSALGPQARLRLAEASSEAAAARTGTTILWKTAAGGGAVVPVRDPYLSHRGVICRDLQQQAQTKSGPIIESITLCRDDLGDGRIFWLAGSPDA